MSELNPWNYKPWWCQPWSILLTGVAIVGGTWLWSQTLWVSLLIAMPIIVWWVYFLIIWPRLIRQLGAVPDLSPSGEQETNRYPE